MNAAQVLLAGHGDARVALVCGGEAITRGDLRDAVARAASQWHARGLRRGDRVAIRLPDGIDWVVAYLGAIWAGGVAVGVNPHVPADEWLHILDAACFAFVLAERGDETPLPWRRHVVTRADWRHDLAHAAPGAPLPMHADEPALWVHSSGTSGHPKAVVHAHRAALTVERVGRERLGLTAEDRLYASSKLFFTYPLANALLTGLKLGATVILDPQWPTAAGVAATVVAHGATVLFSVPALYRNLAKEGMAGALAAAGVRVFVSAGEPLPPPLRESWQRQAGRTIVDGYGASETLVLVLVDRDDGRGLRASPGWSVTPQDGAAACAAPGRILVRGPSVALGYWKRPDAQAEHFRDGGFAPSDLFAQRDDGGFAFAGREDSLVKVHGRWVDLVDLEQKFAGECAGVVEAAAVAVPDADGVEAVALFFVAPPGADTQALHRYAGRLPPHQRPRWLLRIDSLPRTATGKLVRRALRERHGELAAHGESVLAPAAAGHAHTIAGVATSLPPLDTHHVKARRSPAD
ncbi:MAG: AMP-binding protein [Burkholderiales bacterium]